MRRLTGKVAVVTGASRSIGRGVALVLGEEGVTVYATGRSVRGEATRDLPRATVEDTAEMVSERGGVGIPVRCDHTVDAEVEVLFERVEREQGRLDILVNNAWDGYDTAEDYDAPFWEQPMWRWDRQLTEGVRIYYTASRLAARLMVRQRSGLIVGITFRDRGKYLGPPLSYDLQKAAVNRMARGMAEELRRHGVAAVALSPGTPRNEFMIDPEELLREYEIPPVVGAWPEGSFVWKTHSTQYVGRAVAALAADPDVMGKSGEVLLVGDLAGEYGFTDIDARYIPPYRIDED